MRKKIIILSLTVMLAFAGFSTALSQEVPDPQQDTVNMDTDAKPTFYYAVEDEESLSEEASGKNSAGLIVIIVGAVIIIGGGAVLIFRKKK